MIRLLAAMGVSAVLALGSAAPAAVAKGGGGGGGSTTTTTTGGGGGNAGGGGGGGGGGRNSGGVNDSSTPAPPAPPVGPACATMTSLQAPVGYYTTYAALWNNFWIDSCSTGGAQTYLVHVTNTNVLSGAIDYDATVAYSLSGGQNVNGVLDNDFAPFDTTYDVEVQVEDASGRVLDAITTRTTTPSPR